jgi:dTDP-4-amino-4,6-dideoxygalactose transaminase
MSNIVAGIGRGQLVYLNEHIQKKRQIYEAYKQAFKDLPVSMNPHTPDSEPNYWLSCMLIDKEYTKVTYQQIMEALLHENIESRPIWKPMHLQPVFQHNDFITVDKDTDVGGDIFSRGLCLPSDVKITEEEQTRVIEIIKGFFE